MGKTSEGLKGEWGEESREGRALGNDLLQKANVEQRLWAEPEQAFS